jgi:cell division protein ZapA
MAAPPPDRTEYITVEIYDQLYHLAGNDAAHLRALAERVDSIMRAVASQGRTVDSLRVAVLTALNLADELTRLEKRGGGNVLDGRARAANLSALLDQILIEERKPE